MAQASEDSQRRQLRQASIVMGVAAVLWLGGLALGGRLGLSPRFAILLDLAAMAAFLWALVVFFKVWRARQNEG